MARIHEAAIASRFAGRPRATRAAVYLVMALTWPIGAVVETMRALGRTPVNDRPSGPLGLVRRGAHMLRLALVRNVPPVEYQIYRLHDPARRHWIDEALYWSERDVLRTLNARAGADPRDVQDKSRFADICRAHGLPSIPTLAVYRGGAQTAPTGEYVPTEPRLWVKDVAGSQRAGANRWTRRDDGSYDDASGRTLAPTALVAEWRRRGCLVQPCLVDHPALAGIASNGILTLRIVTGIERDGTTAIVGQLASIPGAGTFQRPGYVIAAIDRATGCLQRPIRGGALPIAGTVVPAWPDCLALVQHAHRAAFARFPFLGWDVAVTPDGPVLIEANHGWGYLHHQLLDDTPLGRTPFAPIALQYLA